MLKIKHLFKLDKPNELYCLPLLLFRSNDVQNKPAKTKLNQTAGQGRGYLIKTNNVIKTSNCIMQSPEEDRQTGQLNE